MNEGKKEVFSEAKGEGFDVKVLREILRLRKQDKGEYDKAFYDNARADMTSRVIPLQSHDRRTRAEGAAPCAQDAEEFRLSQIEAEDCPPC